MCTCHMRKMQKLQIFYDPEKLKVSSYQSISIVLSVILFFGINNVEIDRDSFSKTIKFQSEIQKVTQNSA